MMSIFPCCSSPATGHGDGPCRDCETASGIGDKQITGLQSFAAELFASAAHQPQKTS
jgi:hypothetical protein